MVSCKQSVASDKSKSLKINASKRIDTPLGGSGWQFERARFQKKFHGLFHKLRKID